MVENGILTVLFSSLYNVRLRPEKLNVATIVSNILLCSTKIKQTNRAQTGIHTQSVQKNHIHAFQTTIDSTALQQFVRILISQGPRYSKLYCLEACTL